MTPPDQDVDALLAEAERRHRADHDGPSTASCTWPQCRLAAALHGMCATLRSENAALRAQVARDHAPAPIGPNVCVVCLQQGVDYDDCRMPCRVRRDARIGEEDTEREDVWTCLADQADAEWREAEREEDV